MNGARNIEQCGTQTVLRYGHTIQLLHLKTNKYAMADVKRVATQEKDCQYVGVEEDGSMTSWFTILPRYKMRGVGDEVEDSDEVIFELIKQDGSFLHCSKNVAVHLKPFATEGTQLYEASVGSSTGWKMTTYRSSCAGGIQNAPQCRPLVAPRSCRRPRSKRSPLARTSSANSWRRC